LLLDDMVSGAFSSIGFPFEVGRWMFQKLFFLVDGIYPEIHILFDAFQYQQVGMRNAIQVGKRLCAKTLNAHLVCCNANFR